MKRMQLESDARELLSIVEKKTGGTEWEEAVLQTVSMVMSDRKSFYNALKLVETEAKIRSAERKAKRAMKNDNVILSEEDKEYLSLVKQLSDVEFSILR